ncbi:MAG: DUF4838 domain-containing protein [Lentisphaeraceae bacterium]|nr:DUF4838 domain-containing protein [Lentisphaeraceae bacterium]
MRISIFAFALLFSCLSSYALDFVKNGQAVCEFILPDGCSTDEKFSVKDSQRWIKEMTGAEIPILKKASESKNTKIFIGKSFANKYTDDLKKLAGTDGYAIRNDGENVYVFAARPRGVLYGVFDLLEMNTDIIFSRPNTDFGTVHGNHTDLPLTKVDKINIPIFNYRAFSGGHPPHMESGKWLIRNGINRVGRSQFNGNGWDMMLNTGSQLFRPLKPRLKDKPEWFGWDPVMKRRMVTPGEGTLCLSQPGLPVEWAKAVARDVTAREKKTGQKAELYLIGPGDNWFCCRCEECEKPITLPDGKILEMKHYDATKDPLFRSTQVYMFLNEAMPTFKKLLPHVKPEILAYIHFAEPPAVDIHPDLHVHFAPYPTNSMRHPLLDERQPKLWRTRFQTWLKKTPNFGIRNYFFSKPSPQAYYAAANFRAIAKHSNTNNSFIHTEYTTDRGSKGLGLGAHGWDMGAMHTWVITKLFWNPHQNVDELYAYFIKRTFREASPYMQEYFEMIRDSWLDPKNKTVDACHASLDGVYEGMIVKQGLQKKCMSLLEKAEKAALHPNSKIMITRMKDRYKEFAKKAARLVVDKIDELGHDGHTFSSVQWEKPEVMSDFKITTRLGEAKESPYKTEIEAAHAGNKLYIRIAAYDDKIAQISSLPKDDSKERWPKGDHMEIWFKQGNQHYTFAFDSNGNKYDAKEYDSTWNSDWKVITQKGPDRWESILIIPLKSIGLKAGQKSNIQWMTTREINHGDSKPVNISYQGQVLYKKYFPLVLD